MKIELMSVIAVALCLLFLFGGVIGPILAWEVALHDDPPDQANYRVDTIWDKTYYVTEYDMDGTTLLLHDYLQKPGIIFWDFDWQMERQERSFPEGTYTIEEITR